MITAILGSIRHFSVLVDDEDDDPPGVSHGDGAASRGGPPAARPVAGAAIAAADGGALRPGQRVGSYVVEDLLATGGMAAVWRVRHARLGSQHALKVPLSREPAVLARAAREARLQATLRHPNILAATDLVDLGPVPAIVLELVDGGHTLESTLAAGALTQAEVAEIFVQVCDAVGFMHAVDVVHRDLKPGNVLLSRVGDRCVARVADLGLARSLHEANELTRWGQLMGSPLYVAPEQARDAASAAETADVFALGAMLYEMTTGVAPFAAESVPAILERSAAGDFEAPERLNPGIPARWASAIRGALAPDPGRRTPDVATLRAAFTGRATPAVEAPPPVAPVAVSPGAAVVRPVAPLATPETGPRLADERPRTIRDRPLPKRAVCTAAVLVSTVVGVLAWAAQR